jgi:hypothetical protein
MPTTRAVGAIGLRKELSGILSPIRLVIVLPSRVIVPPGLTLVLLWLVLGHLCIIASFTDQIIGLPDSSLGLTGLTLGIRSFFVDPDGQIATLYGLTAGLPGNGRGGRLSGRPPPCNPRTDHGDHEEKRKNQD